MRRGKPFKKRSQSVICKYVTVWLKLETWLVKLKEHPKICVCILYQSQPQNHMVVVTTNYTVSDKKGPGQTFEVCVCCHRLPFPVISFSCLNTSDGSVALAIQYCIHDKWWYKLPWSVKTWLQYNYCIIKLVFFFSLALFAEFVAYWHTVLTHHALGSYTDW